MIRLNLASQDLKEEIKLKTINKALTKIISLILFLTILTSIILLTAKHIINIKHEEITNMTSLLTGENKADNSLVKDINTKLNVIASIQKDNLAWSKMMNDIITNTPADMVLGQIILTKSNKSISLKGFSASREGLLQFKEFLEKSNLYSNINFPVKNLLEKTNINFDLKAVINLENIKQLK